MDSENINSAPQPIPIPQGYGPPLAPEDYPNIDHLVLEDGKPVETIFIEKLHRLLTESLYSSWAGPGEGRPFLVLANVGMFFRIKSPPLVPDVMLSLDVPADRDLSRKENRSYLLWEMGKPPNVVIEFVSDRTGGEDTLKLREYARIGIPYYVIFDPQNWLGGGVLQGFSLRDAAYAPLEPLYFADIGLGLRLWEGVYERQQARWLRWCDQQGNLIPTGREAREAAEARAASEAARAARLAAHLRSLGIDPPE